MKKIALFTFLFFMACYAFATHNRAGEITYRQLSELTYEFTIVTYTKTSSPADKPALEIVWGDGTSDSVPRLDKIPLLNDMSLNRYIARHTFPGPSVYVIWFDDPNRNEGVRNIPKSVETPFYVETVLMINPFLGYNNSPILLQPPIDKGCLNHPFIHNPSAFDPDGDSLSYRLIYCKGADGEDIPGYTYPAANKSFTLDPVTGDLVWDSPVVDGEYNVAFLIEEWRYGILIGYVERDMQIEIVACIDEPPHIDPIADICVEAGSNIFFPVRATDVNNDYLTLTATGGVFQVPKPAIFPQPKSAYAVVSSQFSWSTECSMVRNQPYQVVFKVEDNNFEVNLVDIKSVSIKVVGPAVKNLKSKPVGNSIVLNWDKSSCNEVVGYRVYRKVGMYAGTIECPCTTGVPVTTGYKLISTVDSLNNTTFTDDDQGRALAPGTNYCYIVTAVYKNGAESCASAQSCAVLRKDLPIITNVSIEKTDAAAGQIRIAWSLPTELDTNQIKGPYRYLVYHSPDLNGSNMTLVDSLGMTKGLSDTVYTHLNVNTVSTPHSYRIAFYSLAGGKALLVGRTQVASSIYLSIQPTDNRLNLAWEELVPWTNTAYIIYKLNPLTSVYDSIATTNTRQFADTGLVNKVQYCYKIMSKGAYSAAGLVNPILNFSQETCMAPVDNIVPCPPELSVFPDCNLQQNFLSWTPKRSACDADVLKYRIYYTPVLNEPMALLNPGPLTVNDTSFLNNNLESIAGCYAVASVDSADNESALGNVVCVDNCPFYELPNIFTPNNDGFNDLYGPFPYKYIKDVDMTIYDRWGLVVFKTTDRDIKWDGKNQAKKDCTEGVYFYVCDVHEIRLEGIKTRTLKGTITLIRNTPAKSPE